MRGDIYRMRPNPQAQGHEQAGQRYGVVVQSDDLLGLSTWLVAPTSTSARSTAFRPEIELFGQLTRVLTEQTIAVDPELRLGEFVGRLSPEEMSQVEQALRIVLGLDLY